MTRTLKNTMRILFVCAIFALTGILLVGCNKNEKTTYLELSFNDTSKVGVYPGEIVKLKVEGDGHFSSSDVTVNILSGSEFASIDGLVLTVNSDAVPENSIVLNATLGEVTSNTMTIKVSHIEAESIEITTTKTDYAQGEYFALETSCSPENATRDLNFKIVEGQDYAKIINNKVAINENAKDGQKIKVVAYMGNVESQPFEITVKEKTYATLSYESAYLEEGNVVFDSSVQGDNTILDIVNFEAVTIVNDQFEFVKVLPTFTVVDANIDLGEDEGKEIVRVDENGLLEILRTGKATIKASLCGVETEFTIDARILPTQIKFSQSHFEKEANFNYAVSSENLNNPITFSANVITKNENDVNSQNYILKIEGDANLQFVKENDEWKALGDSSVATYDGENIAFFKIGKYELKFVSNTGCSVEIESNVLKLTINDGVNVSNKTEFANAMENNAKVINLVDDIAFEGGHETYIHQGDVAFYGNGFTLDLSKQDTYLKHKYSEDGDKFLTFANSSTSADPYDVIIEDLNMIGNLGLVSNKKLMELIGYTDQKEFEKLVSENGTDFWVQLTYKFMIYLNPEEYTNTTTYCVPYIKNLNIQDGYNGLDIKFAIDEIEQGGSTPAVENYQVTNMFGDGLTVEGCLITVKDYNIGIVGGTPTTSSHYYRQSAGVNRNESTKITFTGDIVCNNQSNGSSVYLVAQFNNEKDIKAALDALGGIDGIIKTVFNIKLNELLEPYENKDNYAEVRQNLTNYMTNIIDYSGSRETFNLFSFTRNGLDDYEFDEKNNEKLVVINDENIYNGIDTTHQFIVINVYDLLMSIKNLSFITGNVDLSALEPIMLILINNNYVG